MQVVLTSLTRTTLVPTWRLLLVPAPVSKEATPLDRLHDRVVRCLVSFNLADCCRCRVFPASSPGVAAPSPVAAPASSTLQWHTWFVVGLAGIL